MTAFIIDITKYNGSSPSPNVMVLSVPAIPLSVEVKGQGFPILCLHGHPGSAESMAVFTRPLSHHFRTLAPDLRGYGRSQTRQDFTMTDHLTDLTNLLDQQQIDRCLVLGWSLGGILAMELALQQPERISGLILIATSAHPRGNHPPVSWKDDLYTGIASVLNWFKPGWQWNIETFGKRSLYRYLIQQHNPSTYQYIAEAAIGAYLRTSRQATRALFSAIRQGYNRLPDLEQIQCPTLILAGEADRHITAASSVATAQEIQQCEWQIYPNTAHLFPWEIPEQVMGAIRQWLNNHPEVVRSS